MLHLFTARRDTRQIEHYFQYRIRQGRITALRLIQPDVHNPTTARLPDQVELSVVPNISDISSITAGTVMIDDWANYGGA